MIFLLALALGAPVPRVEAKLDTNIVVLPCEGEAPMNRDLERLGQRLRIELLDSALSIERVVLFSSCDSKPLRIFALVDPGAGEKAERLEFRLGDRTQLRATALSVSESIRARFLTAPLQAPKTPSRYSAFASASLKVSPKFGSLVGGARVGAESTFDSGVALRIDVGGYFGRQTTALGEIRIAAALGGLAITLSGVYKWLRWRVGPRLEAGVGWALGRAQNNEVTQSAGRSALALLSMVGAGQAKLSDHFFFAFSLEVGGTLIGLRARVADRIIAGIDGISIGANAGINYWF